MPKRSQDSSRKYSLYERRLEEEFNSRCVYCGVRLGGYYERCYWDHLIPVSGGGRNIQSNLYPSCKECNSVKSHLLFPSLEAAQCYVQEKLRKRHKIRL